MLLAMKIIFLLLLSALGLICINGGLNEIVNKNYSLGVKATGYGMFVILMGIIIVF